jgi:hypothetical protein
MTLLLGYLVVEAAASALYVRGVVWPDADIFLYEESSRTIQFDAVRGYRLTSTPARFVRITHGEVCFQGEIRGNNEGFPDRDDFGPARPDATTRRLAVFGDSFSAGEFFPRNWPDRVEDLATEQGARLQLLNFSLGGSGLMNWLSMMEGYVVASAYEIDGVVLAVYGDDLVRGFHFRDDAHPLIDRAGEPRVRMGYVYEWDADALPRSLAETDEHLLRTRGYVVTHDRFEQALRFDWHPP